MSFVLALGLSRCNDIRLFFFFFDSDWTDDVSDGVSKQTSDDCCSHRSVLVVRLFNVEEQNSILFNGPTCWEEGRRKMSLHRRPIGRFDVAQDGQEKIVFNVNCSNSSSTEKVNLVVRRVERNLRRFFYLFVTNIDEFVLSFEDSARRRSEKKKLNEKTCVTHGQTSSRLDILSQTGRRCHRSSL